MANNALSSKVKNVSGKEKAARLHALSKKMRKSNLCSPPYPVGAIPYKNVFYKPGDDKYFTSKEEIEEYIELLMDEEFGRL